MAIAGLFNWIQAPPIKFKICTRCIPVWIHCWCSMRTQTGRWPVFQWMIFQRKHWTMWFQQISIWHCRVFRHRIFWTVFAQPNGIDQGSVCVLFWWLKIPMRMTRPEMHYEKLHLNQHSVLNACVSPIFIKIDKLNLWALYRTVAKIHFWDWWWFGVVILRISNTNGSVESLCTLNIWKTKRTSKVSMQQNVN